MRTDAGQNHGHQTEPDTPRELRGANPVAGQKPTPHDHTEKKPERHTIRDGNIFGLKNRPYRAL